MTMSSKHLLPVALSSVFLVACGATDGDSAKLSLNLTDAPAAGVTAVNLHINTIELKQNSDTFSFEINQSFNLLDLQGSASQNLLTNVSLPAGQYQYIRLDVNSELSSLSVGDTQHQFDIPSENQSGLKLNSPFTLSANGNANFTLDFDVAKSLSYSNQGYKMRPTIRIVDNSQIGHIAGTVASEIVCEAAKVYAFESDAAFTDMNTTSGPITSSLVAYNEDQTAYEYELGFLEVGSYRIDLVCGEDDPTVADDAGVTSYANQQVSVTEKQTTTANFEVSVN